MKDIYKVKRITELIGHLGKNDDGNFMVIVDDKKDEPPQVIDFLSIIEQSVGEKISFKVVVEYDE
jgi:hypothetical protein